jgi:predicted O-methyltransferase YrrM
MSIEKQLNLKFPIYWNGWPIEKEFAKYLIYTIVTNKPLNIVELGSGTSSLIILKTLKKLGCKYRLTSVDSDKIFLEKTKNLLLAEDVYDEDNVKLIFAPIKELILGEEKYKWYDRDKLNFDFDKIDLLFIDGPIGKLCKNSRYPALVIMKKYLKEGSMAILHDAKRKDELEIVDLWKDENPEIKSISKIDTERGGVEIIF